MSGNDLPVGWYESEEGGRRYWDGSSWLSPAAPQDVPAQPAPVAARLHRRPSKRTLVIAASLVAVLLVGGGVAAAVSGAQAQAARQAAAVRAKTAATEAKAAADAKAAEEQAAADAKAAEDQEERDSRTALIDDLEKSVKKTAKKHVSDGILTGPIISVSCTPLGGGSTDDLTQKTATLECFAANKDNGDGTLTGYTYNATANWSTGSYTWILDR